MQITDSFVYRGGDTWDVIYTEIEGDITVEAVRHLPFYSVGVICFCEEKNENKMVVVLNKDQNRWEMTGGGIEQGGVFRRGGGS